MDIDTEIYTEIDIDTDIDTELIQINQLNIYEHEWIAVYYEPYFQLRYIKLYASIPNIICETMKKIYVQINSIHIKNNGYICVSIYNNDLNYKGYIEDINTEFDLVEKVIDISLLPKTII